MSSRASAGPVSTGVIVGGVAAAATTGALIAMGHRVGSAGIPFAAISATLFHRVAGGAAGLVFTGVVLHITAMFVSSVVFVWLVERVRWSSIVAGAFIGAAQFTLSWLVARGTGEGLASILPLGDRIVFAFILSASLVVGMRFAFLTLRNA